MKYTEEELRELIYLGAEAAREILQNSVYSGEVATYTNCRERAARLALFVEQDLFRLREFTGRQVNGD